MALRWIPKRKPGNWKKTALTATCFGSGMSRWTETFSLFQDATLHSGVLKTAAVMSTRFFGVLSSLLSSTQNGHVSGATDKFQEGTKGFLYAVYTYSRTLFSHMLQSASCRYTLLLKTKLAPLTLSVPVNPDPQHRNTTAPFLGSRNAFTCKRSFAQV